MQCTFRSNGECNKIHWKMVTISIFLSYIRKKIEGNKETALNFGRIKPETLEQQKQPGNQHQVTDQIIRQILKGASFSVEDMLKRVNGR